MGLKDDQLIRLGPWPAGINNLAQENTVPEDALRLAHNVDIDNAGQVGTRPGFVATAMTGTRCHSGWHAGRFPFALMVIDGTLTGVPPDLDTFPIYYNLNPLFEVAYVLVNDTVYWSNSQRRGAVNASGTPLPWGLPTPVGAPQLVSSASGGLFDGQYQVTCTFLNALGEESACQKGEVIQVSGGGGILVSSIPQPNESGVTTIRLYRTQPNDSIFHAAIDLPVGTSSVVLGNTPLGRKLDRLSTSTAGVTTLWDRVPFAYRLAALNDRIAFAYQPVPGMHSVGWTQPLAYGLWVPTRNTIGFGASIDLLVGVGDGTEGAGLYVGSGDKTYFLAGGNPNDFAQKIVYPHGVIPGTQLVAPGSIFGLETTVPVAYWISRNGFACLGLPGGTVQVLREHEAQAPLALKGASLLREINGQRHAVTALSQAVGGGMRVEDRASIKVYRNGVEI